LQPYKLQERSVKNAYHKLTRVEDGQGAEGNSTAASLKVCTHIYSRLRVFGI